MPKVRIMRLIFCLLVVALLWPVVTPVPALAVTINGTITTVAGTGSAGYSGDGGAATSAQLFAPSGVAVDSGGNIYIADRHNHKIRKVDTAGTVTTVAGTGIAGYSGDGGASTAAQLNYPYEVAVDSGGNLYFTEYGNNRIRKVDINGVITTVAGSGSPGYSGDGGPATSAQLFRPSGVAVDSGGNLYIADTSNHRIRKVDTTGTITTVAGTGVGGYSGDGGAATSAELGGPNGVTVDSGGNLYIADTYSNRVRKVDATGTITTVAGTGVEGYSGDGGAASSARLNNPTGAVVDSGGNLYIADFDNDRIRKVDTVGIITTIAGTGVYGYSGDGGAATGAQLARPSGVAVDNGGNLYIADNSNNRIRKVIQLTDSEAVALDKADLAITYGGGDSAASVTQDLTLPTAGDNGTTISWSSSNTSVIANDGTVTRPAYSSGNASVTLTATISKGSTSDTKTFNLTVIPNVLPEVTAATATLTRDGVPATVTITKTGTNQFEADLTGTSNSYMFTHLTMQASASVAQVQLQLQVEDGSTVNVEEQFSNGTADIDVNAKLDALDSGEPGISLQYMRQSADANGDYQLTGTLTDVNGNQANIMVTLHLSVDPEVTAATATLAEGNDTETITVTRTAANQFEADLIGSSDSAMFTQLTMEAAASVAQVQLQLQVEDGSTVNIEEQFSAGTADVDVHAKLGVLDAGEPGISLQYMRQSADANGVYQFTGTLTDINGNQAAITVTLHLSLSPAASVAADKAALEIDYGGSDSAANVTQDLTLPAAGANGTAINWSSSNTSVIANDGTVTRPAYSSGDASVTLTATISKGSASDTREFSLTVIKLPRSITGDNPIITVAGTGEYGYSGDGGAATSAQLYYPQGVAVDSMGNLYIADTSNRRIRKLDTAGSITTVAGGGSNWYSAVATDTYITKPVRVAVDSGGNLYIADDYDNVIRKVDTTGTITTVAGSGNHGYSGDGGVATSALLNQLKGVTVDTTGNLYIADSENNRIRKVDTNGIITTVAGTGIAGYSGDGGAASSAQLYRPHGVAVDNGGNIYIADSWNHRIRKIDTYGTITTVAGAGIVGSSGDGGAATSALLHYPYDVAVDSGGNLYIAANQRIRKVDTSGIITTVAGTGQYGYSGDGGVATSAQLYNPYDIVIDSNGNLYIADSYNHRIRKVAVHTINEAVNLDKAELVLTFSNGDSTATVTQNIAFPIAGANGTSINWSSSDPSVIANDGTVTRPAYSSGDASVILTATISMGSDNETKTFDLTVLKLPISDSEAVAVDKAALAIGYGGSDSAASVTQNLTLPIFGANGTTISWGSSSQAVIANDGTITRPSYLSGNASVTLTATITKGSASDTRDFTLTVIANVLPEVTAATATLTKDGAPATVTITKTGTNQFETDLTGTSDSFMFTHLTMQASASVGQVLLQLQVEDGSTVNIEEQFSNGTADIDVHAKLGALDAGEPGISLQYMRQSADANGDYQFTGTLTDIDGNQAPIIVTLHLSVAPEVTAATATFTDGNDTETIEVTRIAANQFESDLTGSSDDAMFTHLTMQAAASVAQVQLQLQVEDGSTVNVEEQFSNGTADIDVHAKRGALDAGEPGISLQYMRQVADANGDYQFSGTLTDINGNQAAITVTLHLSLSPAASVAADKAALEIGYGGSDSAASVTQDLTLPTAGANGTSINWSSSDPAVIANDGTITRSAYTSGDASVTLTATISKGSASDTRAFNLTVIKLPISDNEAVAADKAALAIGYGGSDSATSVTQNLTLPASGANGTSISWSSSDPVVITNDGTVTRPAYSSGDASVTLTATISKGSASDTRAFNLTMIVLPRSVTGDSIITTVAGTGVNGYSGDGGVATSAQLYYPQGVAVDSAGNLYIADSNNHRIRKVDTTGTITTVAGTGSYGYSGDGGVATSAKLNSPYVVAVDSDDNLYIADRANHRIRKVNTNGIITTVAGSGSSGYYSGDGGVATSAQLNAPQGVAVDSSGNLYIADSMNNRIRKVDTAGIITTVAGTGIDSFSGDGGAATNAQLYQPAEVEIDSGGNLYIADTGNHRIRKVDTNGIITTMAGSGNSGVTGGGYAGDGGAATSAQLLWPSGVTVDSSGNLYVADRNNNRIRKVDTAGIITTVAGTGIAGFSGDGGAADGARIYYPFGLSLDGGGNLYIADSVNHRVRMVAIMTNSEAVTADMADLAITFSSGDSAATVTQGITLPTAGANGTTISWSSSDPAVISTNGSVARPAYLSGDASVTLTATISKGSASDTKTFNLKVLKLPISDSEAVAVDKAALAITYGGSDSATSVTQNLNLPTSGDNGTSISWSSSDPVVIANNGTVTRPAYPSGDASVTLTATISKGSASDTRDFAVTVAANTLPEITAATATLTSGGVPTIVAVTETGTNQFEADLTGISDSAMFTHLTMQAAASVAQVQLQLQIDDGSTVNFTEQFSEGTADMDVHAKLGALDAGEPGISLQYMRQIADANGDYQFSGTLTDVNDNQAHISVTLHLSVEPEVTAATATLTTGGVPATVTVTKTGNNQFEADLTGSSDDAMFTHLTMQAAASVAQVQLQLQVEDGLTVNMEEQFAAGTVNVDVHSKLGDLDSGEPGISLQYMRQIADANGDYQFSGTLTDVNGNQAPITVTLHLTDGPEASVTADKASLEIGYSGGDSAASVTQNLFLPTAGANGTSISWNSSDPAIITNEGNVTRPAHQNGDAYITLTAAISKGTVSDTKTFNLTVLRLPLSDIDAVLIDKDALEIGYAGSDYAASVTQNLFLPTAGANGTTISWTTSDPAIIANNGTVTRPVPPSGDASINLTATIIRGSASHTRMFTVTVLSTSLPEVTTATATLTQDSVPAAVDITRTGTNQFEADLTGRNDTEMFTHLTMLASPSVVKVQLELQVAEGLWVEFEQAFSNGTADLDVHAKLGALDAGEPGISLQFMRQSADANGNYQLTGTVLDINGNQAPITVTLHLVETGGSGGEPGPIELSVDKNIYQGLGDAVTVTVSDAAATAAAVQVINEKSYWDEATQSQVTQVISNITVNLTETEPGRFTGSFGFAPVEGANLVQVEAGEQNWIKLVYGDRDLNFGWLPAPGIQAERNGMAVTSLSGYSSVKIKANYLPSGTDSPIILTGTSDNGTPGDINDDLQFNLDLDFDSQNSWPGKQWDDFKATVTFDLVDSGYNVIPVNPAEINIITLSYDQNGVTASATLSWNPPGFDFNIPEGGYTGIANQFAIIDLTNTGLSMTDKLLVTGISQTADQQSQQFQIVMFQGMEQGSYNRQASFISAGNFTQQPLNNDPGEIPVFAAMENTITLTYRNDDGTVLAEGSFVWTPNPDETPPGGSGYWNNANLPPREPGAGSHVINGLAPQLDVYIDNFTGDSANLSVQLLTDAGETIVTIATLSSASQVGTDDTVTIFRFSPQEGSNEADALALPNANSSFLQTKLVYTDPVEPTNEAAAMMDGILIDNQPPGGSNLGLEFGGLETAGAYQGMYRFTVHLGDEFGPVGSASYDTLVSSNFILKRSGEVVQDAYNIVVPEADNNDTIYRKVNLYLASVQNQDVLQIQNLVDRAGLQMTEAAMVPIMLGAQVEGTVQNAAGDPVNGAELLLIPYDVTKGLRLDRVRFIHTNESGQFQEFLGAGTYKLTKVNWGGQEFGPPAKSLYLDRTIVIPMLAGQDTYSLNIQLPAEGSITVTGQVENATEPVVLIFAKTAYLTATVDDEFIHMVAAMVKTEVDGSFNAYLPAGKYKLLGKQEGMSIMPPTTTTIFTISPLVTEPVNIGTIIFPEKNVFGTLTNASGAVTPAEVAVVPVGYDADNNPVYGQPVTTHTGGNGEFGFALNDGDYAVAAVVVFPPWDKTALSGNEGFYLLDVTFTVLNSQVTSVAGTHLQTGGTTLDYILLPAPNVTVQLTEGGALISQDGLITLTGGNLTEEVDIFGQGQFNFHLLPGTYTFTKAELFGAGFRQLTLNQPITVDQTTDYTGPNALNFDVQGASNVKIAFVNDNNEALGSGYAVDIERVGMAEWFWSETNSNGEIYLELATGTYRINGYSKEENNEHSWHELKQEFRVTKSHTSSNKLEVVIKVKTPNVSGTVFDDENVGISWAWVDLQKQTALFPEFLGFSTNQAGQFALSLDDGTYVIKGVGTPNQWIEMNIKFYVIDGLVHKQADGSDAPISPFNISKPAPNVSGHVYKDAAKTTVFAPADWYEGSGPTEIWLVVRENVAESVFQAAPWKHEKWIEVKVDGSFAVTLEEAKQYKVRAIATPEKWIELDGQDYQFTVGVNSTGLEIVPPVPNVSGTVLDFAGNVIGPGWLNLEKEDGTGWLGTAVSQQGEFGLNLTPGSVYTIRDVNWEAGSAGSKQHNWMQFNKKITVPTTGTLNLVLRPNLKGIITIPLNATQQGDYGVNIREVIAKTDSRYEDARQNPWKYESWFGATYNSDSQQLTFTGYLEEGKTYLLAGINSPGGWSELKEEFQLSGADAGNVSYDSANETYTLTLDSQPNVTGEITKNGSPVANAWVNFERVVEQTPGSGTWDPDNNFGTNTNASGQFSLKLKDGQYRVNGYGTPGQWVNNKWMPGEWVNLNYPFQVVGEALQDMDGNSLDQLNLGTNVTGKIQRPYKTGDVNNEQLIVPAGAVEGDYVTLKWAWLSIRQVVDGEVDFSDWSNAVWANSNVKGEFALMMSPGNYRVTEAGGHDFWSKMAIDFQVDASGLVAGDNVVNGQLLVRPQLPNLRGELKKANGSAIKFGWLALKPATAKQYDWQNVQWVNTDQNGKFQTYLSNGNWQVAEAGGPGTWFKVGMPFSVDNSTISSDWSGAVVNGQLVVQPPTPNLAGIVYNNDGVLVSEKAWITIKPASAGQHEWENSVWAETRNYSGSWEFRLRLDAGDYKVVNAGGRNFGYDTNIPFTVQSDGTVDPAALNANGKLAVSIPEPNVTGTAVDENDNLFINGWVNLIRINATGAQVAMDGTAIQPGPYDHKDPQLGIYWNHSRGTGIDGSGDFRMRLEPGVTYKIMSINGEVVGGGWAWYNPKQQFTVAAAGSTVLSITPPQANVTIIVTNTNLTASEAWLDVKLEKDGATYYVPVRLQSYDAANSSSYSYTFAATLENGSYEIASFGTPNYWTEVDEQLVVDGSASVTIDFAAGVKVKVSGALLNGAEPLTAKAWVAIQPVVDGQVDMSVAKKWLQTNTNGQFTYKLIQDETWAITDVTTSAGYVTVENPLNYAYTVTADAEQTPGEWQVDINSLQQ